MQVDSTPNTLHKKIIIESLIEKNALWALDSFLQKHVHFGDDPPPFFRFPLTPSLPIPVPIARPLPPLSFPVSLAPISIPRQCYFPSS